MEIHEFDWDELLALIEAGEVIIVVGRELLTTDSANEPQLYHRLLATKLAAALQVPETGLPSDYQLNEVATAFLKSGGRRNQIYSRLKTLLDETPLAIPESLLQLAGITDFDLYISTSFDDSLTRALNQVRYGGKPGTTTLCYSLHNRDEDLPQVGDKNYDTFVFKVFGSVSPMPEYAVTDEDMLEFLHRLQEDNHRPARLFDTLYNRNLLLIGCGFPDWLARFFIRTLSRQRLLEIGDTTRFMVDRETRTGTPLMLFLQDWHTEIYLQGDPVEFVDELYQRWSKRNTVASPVMTASTQAQPETEPMLPGSIFLSYSRDDINAVRKLHTTLEQAGMDVWVDMNRLGSGDAWELLIQGNIRHCSLFLPIISRKAAERMEGFYRREWRWAIDRAQGFAEHMPFIIPVIIDDLPSESNSIPSYFWNRQMERAPDGLPSADVIDRLRKALRLHQLQQRGKT